MPTLVAKRRAAQVPCGGREQVLALQQEQQRIFSKEQLIVIFTLLKRQVKGQHAPRRGIASSFYSRARAVRAWKQTHITRSARDEARAGIVSSFARTGRASQRLMLTSRR